MRRDIVAILYWALRWHEGRRVSYGVLCEVLWGEFACKPKDLSACLRELMAYVQQRHGDKWVIEDCGGAFRISPRKDAEKRVLRPRRGRPKVRLPETRSVPLPDADADAA
jgi:hypothetical protein